MSQLQKYQVPSLFDCSVDVVVEFLCISDDWDALKPLPTCIKDVLFSIMCRRGKVTDKTIEALIHKKTKAVSLFECDITDYGLLQLEKCEELLTLDMNSFNPRESVSSAPFARLFDSCHKLREVGLRHCVNINDDAIFTLAVSCPDLTCLDISNCISLTNKSLEALGMFSHNLEFINFSNTLVHDEGVRLLVSGNCKDRLKELFMRNCCFLTGNAVKHVATYCSNLNIFVFDEYPEIYYGGNRESDADSEEEFGNEQRRFMKQISWTIS